MSFVFLRQAAIWFLFFVSFTATSLLAANYVEGEALITFKDSVSIEAGRQALNSHHLELTKHFRSIFERSGRHIGLVRSKNLTTDQLIAMPQHDPAIQIAEPSFLRRPFGTVPNDTFFTQLWGLCIP